MSCPADQPDVPLVAGSAGSGRSLMSSFLALGLGWVVEGTGVTKLDHPAVDPAGTRRSPELTPFAIFHPYSPRHSLVRRRRRATSATVTWHRMPPAWTPRPGPAPSSTCP